MIAARFWMFSSTVLPSRSVSALSDSVSVADEPAKCATMSEASVWNCSFLATKSVSAASSMIAPSAAATRPLLATRSCRFSTLAELLMRRISSARSYSPSASSRAFLHSIIPAPVASRSFLTSAAEIFAISRFSRSKVRGKGGSGARRGRRSRVARGARLEQVALPLRHRLVGGQLATRDRLGLLVATRVGGQRRAGDQAVGDRVGDHAGQQLGAADRVVVTRDRVIDLVRVAVGVEDRDDRDAQLAGFADGDVLLLGVDDPNRARHLGHLADAAERPLQLGHLAGEEQLLLLGGD